MNGYYNQPRILSQLIKYSLTSEGAKGRIFNIKKGTLLTLKRVAVTSDRVKNPSRSSLHNVRIRPIVHSRGMVTAHVARPCAVGRVAAR